MVFLGKWVALLGALLGRNWEQGSSAPNGQAITLLKLVQRHPETLTHKAEL